MGAASVGVLPFTMWIAMLGLPMGVPPLPEDPMMAKIAPEQCLFYLSSAGVAEPKATSENQLEQLLAEPEVRQMSADIERLIDRTMAKAVKQGGMAGMSADEAAMLAKLFIACPKAVYLADLQVHRNGPPQIRAGALLGLGDSAEKVKTLLATKLANGPFQTSESNGTTWYQIQPAPDAPLFKFGVKDRYFVLGVGEGEAEAMLKRADGKAPAWLEQIGRELPIERRSMVEYVNVAKLRDMLLAAADDPHAAAYVEAFGLNNVTAIYAAAGLDKTDFTNRTLVAIDGEPRGIFRAATAKPLAAADAKTLPADAMFAAAMRLDPQQVWDIFLSIAEKTDPSAKAGISEGMRQFQEVLGMKMPDDLLGPFGDTVCLYDSPSEGGMGFGVTATIKVKDAAKAKTAFDKVMVFLKMKMNTAAARQKAVPQDVRMADPNYFNRPRIDTLEVAGKEIYALNPGVRNAFVAFSWCLTDDELIFALFPQSIKGRLTRGANFRSLADSPEADQLLADANGLFAAGYCDTKRLFDFSYPMFLMMFQSVCNELQRQGIDANVGMLPSAGAIRRHLTPELFGVRRTKSGIEITDRGALPGVGLATVAPMAAFAILPARMAARDAAFRAQSMNNMKQIGLAMHNYHDSHRTFPPAFKADKNGKPLLSWRVLILPQMEQDTLFQQFHLDEPWDSEHNKSLLRMMPMEYRSPNSKAGPGMTNYLTVRGEKAIFTGSKPPRIADIADGTSRTIMLVEASDEKAVPWTKPDDFEYDENDPIKGLVGLQQNGFLALMADGSARMIGNSIKPSLLNALFTRDGNEPIDWNQVP